MDLDQEEDALWPPDDVDYQIQAGDETAEREEAEEAAIDVQMDAENLGHCGVERGPEVAGDKAESGSSIE